MKKCLMMILLTILTVSCGKEKVENKEVRSDKAVNCEFVGEDGIGNSFSRCENEEIICYSTDGAYSGAIQCYFKQSLKIKDGLNAISDNLNPSN